jgi:hypothetical protein
MGGQLRHLAHDAPMKKCHLRGSMVALLFVGLKKVVTRQKRKGNSTAAATRFLVGFHW